MWTQIIKHTMRKEDNVATSLGYLGQGGISGLLFRDRGFVGGMW